MEVGSRITCILAISFDCLGRRADRLSHSQRFPASIHIESRLSRSSVLSIRSSRASCISPSSRHIHTYIHRSSLSPARSSLRPLVHLFTSTFPLHPRFSFPQCTLILRNFRVPGRRTRRRVPQPSFSIVYRKAQVATRRVPL